ncbi:hypothetical protein TKK_0014093 [Trichogramma kaykai]
MELSKVMNKLRDASNWQEWKFLMTMHLDDADLLQYCDGTKVMPTKTEENKANFDAQLAAWQKADKTVRKTIAMMLESKPLQLIMDCSSARSMWSKLHTVYEMKSEESLALVQKKFFDFKWDSTGSMSQHISNLEQLSNKMKQLHGTIPMSMLITRILCTLPAKYDHFHSAWDSTEATKKTLENLTTRLLTEEMRLDNRDNEESVSTALLSKLQVSKNVRNHDRKSNDFKGKIRRCYNCKSTEHIQRDCPGCRICKSNKHLAHKCPNKNKKGDSERQDNPSEYKHVALIGTTGSERWHSNEDWIIDSGASDHMTPRREWLIDYREYNEPRSVEIGNGILLAVGEGEQGIKHTVCVPYSPEQNGCAERANRTIVEAVRSMLHSNKDMPMSLWAEAANCAIFVLNMTGPSRINSKTPYELWYDKDIKLPDLKVFGTECFSHIPKQKRQKLDKKSVKGFVEASVELLNDECVAETEDAPIENEEFFDAQHNESDASPHTNTEPRYLLRDRSVNRQPIRYGIPQAHSFIARSVPNNYRDAVNSRESNEWRAAMREEMDSLTKNKTWILTEKPHNKKPIDCRWVFRIKEHADSTLERRKARLVIKGFAQKEGIDYTETFSPVARFETIRTIISIAAKNNLSLSQFDIKTAFLNGTVKEEIYMKQPEGFADGSDRVCKLLKSLYGLKQAPRCWTEVFKKFLISFGLRESTADSCLYYNPNDEFIFIIVFWVDDGLVATSSEKAQSEFFSRLRDSFEFTMTQKVEYYLGIEIKIINEKGIFINQAKYIREMLEKFNMKNCNAVATPIVSGWESNQNINSDEALQD